MGVITKKESNSGIIDTLQKASWRYVGNGNWIDPETKQKHMTSIAFEIAKKRKFKKEVGT